MAEIQYCLFFLVLHRYLKPVRTISAGCALDQRPSVELKTLERSHSGATSHHWPVTRLKHICLELLSLNDTSNIWILFWLYFYFNYSFGSARAIVKRYTIKADWLTEYVNSESTVSMWLISHENTSVSLTPLQRKSPMINTSVGLLHKNNQTTGY